MFSRLKKKLTIIKSFFESNSFISLIKERKVSLPEKLINKFIFPEITSKISQLKKAKVKLEEGQLNLYLFPSNYISKINLCLQILQCNFTKKQRFISFQLINQIRIKRENSFNTLVFPLIERITTKFIKCYLEELYIDDIKIIRSALNLYHIDLSNIEMPGAIKFVFAFLNVTGIKIKEKQIEVRLSLNKNLLCI